MGFYCTHKYAHTSSSVKHRLPFALKGVDVAVYAIFRALGLSIKIRPILHTYDTDVSDTEYDLVGKDLHKLNLSREGFYDDDDIWQDVIKKAWPHNKVSNIVWMNNWKHKEVAWAINCKSPVISYGKRF